MIFNHQWKIQMEQCINAEKIYMLEGEYVKWLKNFNKMFLEGKSR